MARRGAGLSGAPGASGGLFQPPPLLPGIPIVWTPKVVVGALDAELRILGLDPAERAGPYLDALGVVLQPGSLRPFVRCPGCGASSYRLFWASDRKFRGSCCWPARQRGFWLNERLRLHHQAGDTLFAARLGSLESARRVQKLGERLGVLAPTVRTLHQAMQFTTLAAVLQIATPPAPVELRTIAKPGPLSRALAGDRLDVLVHDVWRLPVYAARVRMELGATGFAVGA